MGKKFVSQCWSHILSEMSCLHQQKPPEPEMQNQEEGSIGKQDQENDVEVAAAA